jgi:hypothetical protein
LASVHDRRGPPVRNSNEFSELNKVLCDAEIGRKAVGCPESVSPRLELPTVAASQPATRPDIAVYFSPKGGCTEAIAREINNAESNIYVQAYPYPDLL